MNEQPTLGFTNPRQPIIDRALDNADERFKQEYLALLMEFVRSGQDFIAQDVRDRWTALGKPKPREWRAIGGMYQKLIHAQKVEIVGYRKRDQGSITAVYRGRI